jgi:hypothetical protein
MSRLTTRACYVAAALLVIAAGLLARRPEVGLPWAAAKYGGSVLWGAMVFFIVAALAVRWPLGRTALVAATASAAVEFSQLIHVEPLDAFRRSALGALLLGRTFSWWDVACYWIGIAAAALLTAFLRALSSASLHTRL